MSSVVRMAGDLATVLCLVYYYAGALTLVALLAWRFDSRSTASPMPILVQ